MRTLLLLSLFTFYFQSVYSQSQSAIHGSVKDSEGVSIPHVLVRLIQKDSTYVTGTMTDSLGRYEIEGVEPFKEYILSFNYYGSPMKLVSVHVSEEKCTVPEVVINTAYITLDEVNVAGQSVFRSKDKVLIIPPKKITKHSRTAYDLLYNLMIPNIEVDRQKGIVKTMGGNVTLYINSRKVDYREVQNLRPSDVQKIEYFDNPTGIYLGDIAAINYITKKKTSGGYVAVDAKQMLGFLGGDYNLAAKLVKNKTSYSLFGGYSMQEYDETGTNSQETFMFPDYTLNRSNRTTESLMKNNRQYLQFISINENKRRTLTAKAAIVRNESPDNTLANELEYSGYYQEKATSRSKTNKLGLMPSLDLYGGFRLPNNQILNVSISGSVATNDHSRSYTENSFTSNNDINEQFYNMNGSLSYSKPLKHKNSIAVKLHHFHKISLTDYSGDYDLSQRLWTGETLLFFGYNQQIGKKIQLSLQPGVSFLQHALSDENTNRQYSARLSSTFVYAIAEQQQLRLLSNIGNSSPNISYLNSADQVVDVVQIKRGNPNLKNMYLYNNAMVYSLFSGKFNLQSMFIYNYYKNAYSMNYFAEGDKMVTSFTSDDDYQQLIGVLSATWKLTKDLHLKGELAAVREINSGSINLSQNSIRGGVDLNYFVEDFVFNIYFKAPVSELKMGAIHTYVGEKYGASVGWNRNNWSVEVGANTPFTKRNRMKNEIPAHNYQSVQNPYSRMNQQFAYLKIARSINFGKKVKQTKERVDTNVNSAILDASD